MSTPQLLLVEDDAAVAEVVAFHLRGAGYDVEHAADGHQALRRIESQRWDLVLLDVMLPGADGFEICRRLRAPSAQRPAGTGDHVPIIMLSARTAEAERVLGLELGADDYLAKPFSMLELTARVRALLRRVHQLRDQLQLQAASPVLQAGSLQLDVARRSVFLAGQPLALTLREFDLLHFLARHPGQIFSRSELLQRVWGDGFDGFEHTVNSHINRLRSKLEGEGMVQGAEAQPVRAAGAVTAAAAAAAASAAATPAAPAAPAAPPRLIETVWGLGYRFNAPGQQAAPARSGSAWGAARQGAAA